MNVVETIQALLNKYPQISEFSGGTQIDYTENKANSFGLSSMGESLIREDILGNQTKQHNFALYAVNQSFSDYDRLSSSTFLLEFGYWLDEQKDIPISARIGEIEKQGMISSIKTANGMLFAVPTGNPSDGVTYQIQIQVIYKIESEVF